MKPDDLPDLTVKALRELAEKKGVAKVAKLTKSELIDALKPLITVRKPGAGPAKAPAKPAARPAAKAPAKAAPTRTQKKESFTAARSKPPAKPLVKRTQKKSSFTSPRRKRAAAGSAGDTSPVTSKPAAPIATSTSAVRPAPPRPVPAKGPNPGLPVPDRYGRDRLVLMVQDPHHLFAYWELTPETLERVRAAAGGGGTPVLAISVGGSTEFREVDLRGGNYYLAVAPDRAYTAELALRDPQGRLHVLARSNQASTPAPGVSARIDEQWMGVDETFHELLELAGLPGRPGGSSGMSSVARLSDQRLAAWSWQKGHVSTLSSTSLSSASLSSGARLKPTGRT